MTITCPHCGTNYHRPPGVTLPGETRYRCARCQHVFVPAVEEEPEGPETVEDERQFTFDDDDDEPAELEVELEDEDATTERKAPAARGGKTPRSSPDLERRGLTAARFAMWSFFLVTIGYAVLSIYFFTFPERMRKSIGEIPLLGPALIETQLSPANVQLAGVRGDYRRVKGDKLVFVISGTALNNSSVPVRAIQVEGRLIGPQEPRQIVFCGASPHDLQDLSLREINLLQTLEPPRDWALGPGEQADFLVVFVDPPTDLREFAAEVKEVKGAPARPRRGTA